MTNKISRCNICGEFLDSKIGLKRHKDKKHRITASRITGLKSLIVLIIPITDWFSAVAVCYAVACICHHMIH